MARGAGVLGRFERLLASGVRLAASVAPSYRDLLGEPLGIAEELRAMGFFAVEETVTVLPEVMLMRLRRSDLASRTWLGSSCPVVTGMVRRSFPGLVESLEPFPSPMVLHGLSLKERYGRETAVVFLGPCRAKRLEAASHPEAVDLVLTFAEFDRARRAIGSGLRRAIGSGLRRAAGPDLKRAGPLPGVPNGQGDGFDSEPPAWAREAVARVDVSGVRECRRFLSAFPGAMPPGYIVEALACRGGCSRGRASSRLAEADEPDMRLRGGIAR